MQMSLVANFSFSQSNFRSYAVEEKLNTQSLPYKSKSLESICDLICQKYARGKHRMTIKHVEQNVLFPKSAKSYDPKLKNMLVHRASLADLIIICTSYKFLRLNVTKKRTKIFLSWCYVFSVIYVDFIIYFILAWKEELLIIISLSLFTSAPFPCCIIYVIYCRAYFS